MIFKCAASFLFFGVLFLLGCSLEKTISAASVCDKIVAAGIGKNCTRDKPMALGARARNKYNFDLTGVPGKGGAVFDFSTQEDYNATVNAFAEVAFLAGPHRYGNSKTKIFVQMNSGASLNDGDLVKNIVEK
ncbi:hypothetical protein [Aquariibacter albus]|uniref:Lipoprotein n=1 Tax=Aquariibacter albus TaxID=2759899 RepID=A0A839HI04_9BURK|nr:hypothetical protein [Aquariibacter albus]MBB1161056.1 hypothetical protein [Aquariibacter albus]